MSDRKTAPHVAHATRAAQAKPAAGKTRPAAAHLAAALQRKPAAGRPLAALPLRPAAGQPPAATPAAHLTAALQTARRPAPPPSVQPRAALPAGAPHLRAALAAHRPAPAALPARHPAPRPAAAAPAQPKMPAAARQPPASAPPAPRPGHAARGSAALQPYKVIGPDKFWTTMPSKRPWFGYPYVLLGDVRFVAQERSPEVEEDDEAGFLSRVFAGKARIVNRRKDKSIRLSDDGRMAIEHSDLKNRQPKAIFLEKNVLKNANDRLEEAGSPIRLSETGRRIAAITGWTSHVMLREVVPKFEGGSPDQLPQNCNAMAGKVMGIGSIELGETEPLQKMLGLLGRNQYSGTLTARDLRDYARGQLRRQLEQAHFNEHARPAIGEAFMIGSVTNVTELYDKAAKIEDDELKQQRFKELEQMDTFRDYFDDKDKKLNWPYHYGAVIAISGSDRITLENYARGDNRMSKPDPRWFFQMYGAHTGQSFHEQNRGENFVNPLTMVKRPQKTE